MVIHAVTPPGIILINWDLISMVTTVEDVFTVGWSTPSEEPVILVPMAIIACERR